LKGARPNGVKTVKKKLLLEKVVTAKGEIREAERHLEKVIRDLKGGSRAEKRTISAALEEAFAKLKAARSCLVELEKLATS
jgi:outer membrane PBP1 activator LpoA protein